MMMGFVRLLSWCWGRGVSDVGKYGGAYLAAIRFCRINRSGISEEMGHPSCHAVGCFFLRWGRLSFLFSSFSTFSWYGWDLGYVEYVVGYGDSEEHAPDAG